VKGVISFEGMKKLNEHGAEYWSARDLQPLLGYSQWRRFEEAINRAMISCGQSGNNPDYHFAGAGKMIETGKGAAGGARRGECKEVETAAFVSVMQMGGFFITGCSCPMSGVDPKFFPGLYIYNYLYLKLDINGYKLI